MAKQVPVPARPLLGLALCIGLSGTVVANDDCDISSKTCSGGSYEVFFPKSSYLCPPHGSLVMECRQPWEPPYPASLNCEYNYHGYQCEAWPQGDTIRYAYSASGSVRLPYPVAAEAPFAHVACWRSGAGSLTVTITSTSAPGQSSVVSSDLYCP